MKIVTLNVIILFITHISLAYEGLQKQVHKYYINFPSKQVSTILKSIENGKLSNHCKVWFHFSLNHDTEKILPYLALHHSLNRHIPAIRKGPEHYKKVPIYRKGKLSSSIDEEIHHSWKRQFYARLSCSICRLMLTDALWDGVTMPTALP